MQTVNFPGTTPNGHVAAPQGTQIRDSRGDVWYKKYGIGKTGWTRPELAQLDVALVDILDNTIEATGPALGVTTDGEMVFLPTGSVSPENNNAWTKDAFVSDVVIVGFRQGTKAELDVAEPPLMDNEPAWETDTQVLRVGDVRYTGVGHPIEVANNAVKLALTGLSVGQEVLVTGEADRLEKYLGDVAPDSRVPILLTQGAYDLDLVLTPSVSEIRTINGRNQYRFTTTASTNYFIQWDGVDSWEVECESSAVIYKATEDVAYPWLLTVGWVDGPNNTGDDLPPVFTRHPIGADANWEIIGANTFELLIADIGSTGTPGIRINGVELVAQATTNVGWAKEGVNIVVALNGATGVYVDMWNVTNETKFSLNGAVFKNAGQYGWDDGFTGHVHTTGTPTVLQKSASLVSSEDSGIIVSGVPSRSTVTLETPWFWGD